MLDAGLSIAYTRTTDVDISLDSRVAMANSKGAKYFVSIHNNSNAGVPATGTEVWAYSEKSEGAKLAAAVQKALVDAIKLKDRGVKYDSTGKYVIRYTTMPAIIVECCFINNPAEEALLKTDAILDKIARGISQGILNYVGIPAKQPVEPATPPEIIWNNDPTVVKEVETLIARLSVLTRR